MSTDLTLPLVAFELIGHDCPLGIYPSFAVPVGKVFGKLSVVYSGDGELSFRPVGAEAIYSHHSATTSNTLQGFNPATDGLFALNDKELFVYRLGNEKAFYSRFLRSTAAFGIEPFYRLTLAIETQERSLIRPAFRSCLAHLARDVPEFIEPWLASVAPTSPAIGELKNELLKQTESAREFPTLSATSVGRSSDLKLEDSEPLKRPTASRLNPGAVDYAFTNLLKSAGESSREFGPAYSEALQLSTGMPDWEPKATHWVLPSRYERVVNPDDIAKASGLSLPYLEFRNLILNKREAMRFLRLAGAYLSPRELGQILSADAYKQQFHREPTRIKRRQVFTYAEVLSLAGYPGPY